MEEMMRAQTRIMKEETERNQKRRLELMYER